MEEAMGWGPIVFESQEAKYDMVGCARSDKWTPGVGCREKR